MKKLEHNEAEWNEVNEFNRFILEDFIANSTELSPKSLKIYESNLKIWFIWVKNNLENKSQIDVKPLDYKRFQNWLINRGCSSSDVNNKRSAISSLNGYIEIYYRDDYPLFRNFINKSIKRPPKAFVHEKQPMTKEEFNHLIDVLTERKDWQKVAYLMFTLDTGCRREESRQLLREVINAKPVIKAKTFVDAEGNELVKEIVYYLTHPIRCKGAGRTGKVRRFTFSEATMNALKKWSEERGEDDCEFMFVANHQGKVKQVCETLFNSWATNTFAKIIGRRAHPHQLRASRATQLSVEDGVDMKVVQKLLGHEQLATTQGYVIRDDSEDLDELYIED